MTDLRKLQEAMNNRDAAGAAQVLGFGTAARTQPVTPTPRLELCKTADDLIYWLKNSNGNHVASVHLTHVNYREELEQLNTATPPPKAATGLVPDSQWPEVPPCHAERVERIAEIETLYLRCVCDTKPDFVTDLLTDLMHYCRAEKINMGDRLWVARNHFETEEKGLE